MTVHTGTWFNDGKPFSLNRHFKGRSCLQCIVKKWRKWFIEPKCRQIIVKLVWLCSVYLLLYIASQLVCTHPSLTSSWKKKHFCSSYVSFSFPSSGCLDFCQDHLDLRKRGRQEEVREGGKGVEKDNRATVCVVLSLHSASKTCSLNWIRSQIGPVRKVISVLVCVIEYEKDLQPSSNWNKSLIPISFPCTFSLHIHGRQVAWRGLARVVSMQAWSPERLRSKWSGFSLSKPPS